MKAFRIILVIALLLTIAIPTSAIRGFYNGNRYLEFSRNAKTYYVAGLTDMARALTKYWKPEKYKNLSELTKGMTNGQLVLIFDKYLGEHPEELHWLAAETFLLAITELIDEE